MPSAWTQRCSDAGCSDMTRTRYMGVSHPRCSPHRWHPACETWRKLVQLGCAHLFLQAPRLVPGRGSHSARTPVAFWSSTDRGSDTFICEVRLLNDAPNSGFVKVRRLCRGAYQSEHFVRGAARWGAPAQKEGGMSSPLLWNQVTYLKVGAEAGVGGVVRWFGVVAKHPIDRQKLLVRDVLRARV